MKTNIFTRVLVVAFVLLMVLAIPAGASSAYQTYTYSINGSALYSPDSSRNTTRVNKSAYGCFTVNALNTSWWSGL